MAAVNILPPPVFVFDDVPRKVLFDFIHGPGYHTTAGVPITLHIADSDLVVGESYPLP